MSGARTLHSARFLSLNGVVASGFLPFLVSFPCEPFFGVPSPVTVRDNKKLVTNIPNWLVTNIYYINTI